MYKKGLQRKGRGRGGGGGHGFVWLFGEKIKKVSSCFHAPLHNVKFGQFTSLSGRGRQRNVPKRKTHSQGVQSFCFCSLELLFDGVLVAVFVVPA